MSSTSTPNHDQNNEKNILRVSFTTKGHPIRQEKNKSLKHIPCNHVSWKDHRNHSYIWYPNRRCPHQDRCWYAHTAEEWKKHLQPKPCRDMKPDGSCPHPNCKFDHSIKPQEFVQVTSKETKVCRYLQPDGTCKFGKMCKFSHVVYQPLIPKQMQDLLNKHNKRQATPFLVDFADDDEEYEDDEKEEEPKEEIKVVKNADKLFTELLEVAISKLDCQTQTTEMLAIADRLNDAATKLMHLYQHDELDRSIDIDLPELSEEQMHLVMNVFQSLTESKLEFSVARKSNET